MTESFRRRDRGAGKTQQFGDPLFAEAERLAVRKRSVELVHDGLRSCIYVVFPAVPGEGERIASFPGQGDCPSLHLVHKAVAGKKLPTVPTPEMENFIKERGALERCVSEKTSRHLSIKLSKNLLSEVSESAEKELEPWRSCVFGADEATKAKFIRGYWECGRILHDVDAALSELKREIMSRGFGMLGARPARSSNSVFSNVERCVRTLRRDEFSTLFSGGKHEATEHFGVFSSRRFFRVMDGEEYALFMEMRNQRMVREGRNLYPDCGELEKWELINMELLMETR